MVISAAFQTRARTIDHLGREQIADCPTAIAALENYEMKRCKKERPVDDGPLRKNRINRESDRLIRILAVQPA